VANSARRRNEGRVYRTGATSSAIDVQGNGEAKDSYANVWENIHDQAQTESGFPFFFLFLLFYYLTS
jgi:hypothetical protein